MVWIGILIFTDTARARFTAAALFALRKQTTAAREYGDPHIIPGESAPHIGREPETQGFKAFII